MKLPLNLTGKNNIPNETIHISKTIKERFTAKCARKYWTMLGETKNIIPGINAIPRNFQITKQTVTHCAENFSHLVSRCKENQFYSLPFGLAVASMY